MLNILTFLSFSGLKKSCNHEILRTTPIVMSSLSLSLAWLNLFSSLSCSSGRGIQLKTPTLSQNFARLLITQKQNPELTCPMVPPDNATTENEGGSLTTCVLFCPTYLTSGITQAFSLTSVVPKLTGSLGTEVSACRCLGKVLGERQQRNPQDHAVVRDREGCFELVSNNLPPPKKNGGMMIGS